MFQNVEHSDFIKKFYEQIKLFEFEVNDSFAMSMRKKERSFISFTEKEIIGFIVLNKLLSQYIISYFCLCEQKMYVPAFNNIRSAIEILRLFRLYTQDEEFRKAYLNNDNIDFRKTGDYAFMQSKINSRLEKLEHELRKCELIPMTSILGNRRFTKGSNLSDIHSELSKWSHALNVNLLFPIFISENKIKLSIENDDTTYSGLYVKKYTELACLICMDQYELLSPNLVVDKDKIENNYFQLLKSYEKYIELYY